MKRITLSEISTENAKGVLLDLDDTLYEYHPCHQLAYSACMAQAEQQYGIEPELFATAWKKGRDKVHRDLHGQAASHSRLLYTQKLYEEIHGFSNPGFALEMESVYWNTFLKHMALKPEAVEFLETCRKSGIKICIVTDLTAQIQMQKWLKLDLGKYVDFLVSSEEAGVEKPAKAIFELALNKLGLSANEVIMIGDSKEKDIEGAENIGIRAYLV